jgi:hypothetical protein
MIVVLQVHECAKLIVYPPVCSVGTIHVHITVSTRVGWVQRPAGSHDLNVMKSDLGCWVSQYFGRGPTQRWMDVLATTIIPLHCSVVSSRKDFDRKTWRQLRKLLSRSVLTYPWCTTSCGGGRKPWRYTTSERELGCRLRYYVGCSCA